MSVAAHADRAVAGDSSTRSRDTLRFVLPILIFYAVVISVGAHFHEPWRDEADGWLAARDLPLPQIFRFTAYVGAPGLWLLILALPAKLE